MSLRYRAPRGQSRTRSNVIRRATMEVLESRQLLTAVVSPALPTVARSDTPLAPMPGKTYYVQGSASQWDQNSVITPYLTNDLLLNATPTDTDYAACCEATTGTGPNPQINVFTNGTEQGVNDAGQLTYTQSAPGGTVLTGQFASDPSRAGNVLAETGQGDTVNNGGTPIWTATYMLGSASGAPSATGYDISEIDVIAGHQDNRTQMGVDIEVSSDGTNWTSLSGGNDFEFLQDGSGVGLAKGSAQMAIVNDSGGTITSASGVKFVRIDNVQPPGTPNGTWFRELVVTGTATGGGGTIAAPSGVTVSNGGVVTFTDNSTNETGFEVQRATSATGPFNTVGLLQPHSGSGTLSFSDPGPFAPGATYSYRVIAHSAGLGDGVSPVVSPAPGAPGTVTGLAAHRTGINTAVITYNGVLGATSYDVKRGTSLNADGSLGGTITDLTPSGTAGTTVTDTAATGGPFFYVVTASNSLGSGPVSAAARVGGGDGFLASFYSADDSASYPLDGDSDSTKDQPTPDGKGIEASPSGATAVLGYQEILTHVIDYSGNDNVAPPDAPPTFNLIEGAGNQGHAFAARFSGFFTAPATGFYGLGFATDDGGAITIADVSASAVSATNPYGLVNPRTLVDNITALRGNTEDDVAVDEPLTKGQVIYVQFDMNNNGGGWDFHAYDAIASSVANLTAGNYDVQGKQLIDPGDVTAPTPIFKTIDAAFPGGLAKDQPYYTGTATGGPNEVELDFNSIGADSYNVYRSDTQNGTYTKLNSAPIAGKAGTVSYTDTTAVNGTTYFYIVTGVDNSGETSQANGLHLSGSPKAVAPSAPTLLSANVGQLSGINPQTFGVNLVWTTTPITSSYNVLRGSTAGGPYTQVGTGITGTTFTDNTAQANNSYFYVIQAVNAAGASPNSNEVSAVLGAVGGATAANAPTEHFYDNEWWGSQTQNTNGYQSPSLIAHSVTSPYVDPNTGDGKIDLHGDDTAGDPLPPNGDIADNFSTIFSGKIKVNSAGSYTFHANTDDDGYMVIDGQIVATNPGGHGPQEGNTVPITLTAGLHDFAFYQSNGGGGWDWHMEWQGPDSPTQSIVPVGPADGIVSSTESTPKDPTAGSVSINGTTATIGWTDNSTSELEYVLQRSTDSSFAAGKTTTIVLPFVENKGGAVATGSYTDSGLANGTYFYRLQAVNFDGQSQVLSLGSGTVGGGGNFNRADFNHSGKVDFADLLILAQNYGKAADSTHGDANGDGKVDFSDLLILAQNYGKTGPEAAKTRGSMLSDIVGLVKTH